ncbi:MAG: NAD(P)/FAD-dependent oxidoreductase [Flavobacteriales bacterium]
MEFSYWERNHLLLECEHLVVGGGIVGAFTALKLRQLYPNSKICILEKNLFGGGGSTKNAGFTCFGSPTEILSDLKSMGPEACAKVMKMRFKGLEKLTSILGKKNIDFFPCGGIEVFRFRDGDQNLGFKNTASQISLLNEFMLEHLNEKEVFLDASEKCKKQDLRSIEGAIENRLEGSINTGKMMKTLLQLCQENNIQIHRGVNVENFTEDNNAVHTRTSEGTFSSKQLYLCTNGFTKSVTQGIDVQPVKNLVLVSEPIENLKLKGTFHMDEGYVYFRNIENRILIGGGRHWDTDAENADPSQINAIIRERLCDLSYELLPSLGKLNFEYQWNGYLGVGTDKTPIIKKMSPRVQCGVRMGGMGVAIGSEIGEQLALLSTEK